jgi:dihydrofolate reductase
MSAWLRIEAYAIVSSDGMIADENSLMPDSLKFEADQEFFDAALDRVDVVAHGRKSHEGQANSHIRRRLLMTRCVASLEREPHSNNVWLWNPAGASLEDVCGSLGLTKGTVAIIGGTAAYDLFLDRYAEFHLCRAEKVRLPRGTPVFSQVGLGLSPDDVLRNNGMEPETVRTLDPAHELNHVCWSRAANR